MLWRSKSNKNRTAHAGVEPAGDSGQQPDTAKPAPQAEQVVPQPGAPQQPGVPEGNSTAGSVTGAPQPTGAPTTAPGAGAPQHHTVDDALKQASRPTRKEMLAQMAESEEGRAMLKKLQGLRSSMDSLKKQQAGDPIGAAQRVEQQIHEQQPLQNVQSVQKGKLSEMPGAPGARGGVTPAADKEEIRAAEQAVIKGFQEDMQKKQRREEEARKRQLQIEAEHQKALEAEKRAAKISEEAERKRLEALEAEKKAKEVARKKALEAMEAERKAREEAEKHKVGSVPVKSTVGETADMASPEEKAAFFGETAKIAGETKEEQLESLKENLQHQQKRQEKVFDAISSIAGKHTEKLSESQKAKVEELVQAQEQVSQEQKLRLQMQQLKTAQEKAKAEAAIRTRAERARLKAEEKQRHKEEVRKHPLEKVARKRAEKARKLEAKERHKQEKRRLADAKARLEEQSKADAEMGGGIVNVQGVQIKTKVNKHPTYLLRDLLGIKSKAEKQASTEEEQTKLAEERQERQEKVRAAAYLRSIQRKAAYEKSRLGQKLERLKRYSEDHKKGMLMVFAIAVMLIVSVAGVLNYFRAYEYSYNGQVLGIVKEQDDVLQITDLVQGALTEEKNMKVVIDAKDDITFKRVWGTDESKIDNSEQVLKRLTYMGDLKVKAIGIYVDGKKIGAVQDRKTAEKALKDVADKYTKKGDNIEIEKVSFLEKVDIDPCSTDLEDLHSEEEMVDLLCTSGEKETVHKVVAGDTLHSIAKKYDVWEDQLLADNKGINSKKLEVGSNIIVKQQAQVLTYEVVEKITYDKVIEHKVEEQKSADIYEGMTETQQTGSDGLSEITARVTLQNGKKVKEKNLVTTVKEEPVTEVVLVGTKERPPTVGSGKYIWPLKDSFTQTSGFGSRWGRQHKGIDLAVSVGTTVYAADGGTVVEAQYSGSYGNVVMIDHQNGQETRYAHNSKLLVKKGDKVYQGQPIAKSGNTGRSTGPHVHFEIRFNGEPRNPLNYLP
ncbi:MAG: peptidoglycan DD-metalloendopeptidase family protein [Clostridia bacterium]